MHLINPINHHPDQTSLNTNQLDLTCPDLNHPNTKHPHTVHPSLNPSPSTHQLPSTAGQNDPKTSETRSVVKSPFKPLSTFYISDVRTHGDPICVIHFLVSGPVLSAGRPSLAENVTVLLPVQGHPAVLPSTVEFVKPLVSHQQILCRHHTVLNVW